jgi:oxalate decarboxylase/phosphoglucose isomerase-like protein (cupin superfamily)|tara:strand:+ start:150 stop:662 length:513 start_codon:yes stop_codon:yes gene_type:complete
MDITTPFKIEFIKIKITNFKKKKILINKELKKYPEKRFHNFFSNRNNDKLSFALATIFKDEFIKLSKYYGSNINIGDSWSVTYGQGDFHVPHNHGSIGYAGILYLNLKEQSPRTTYIQPWNNEKDKNLLYTPEVEAGDIVIIPKFIMHYSEVNKISFKKRIISFDFKLNQ